MRIERAAQLAAGCLFPPTGEAWLLLMELGRPTELDADWTCGAVGCRLFVSRGRGLASACGRDLGARL